MDKIEFADSLEWHDGILNDVQIKCREGVSIKIIFDLYRNNNDKERKKMIGNFYQVNDINIFIDSVELCVNKGAGNIAGGYIKKIWKTKEYKFFLYLVDGLINFKFRDFNINEID